MTNIDLSAGPVAIADEVFESGSRPEDIQFVLAKIGGGKTEFINRLAIRTALHSSTDETLDDGEEFDLSAARAFYEKQTAQTAFERKNLSTAAPWLSAKSAFGGDMEFVLKLAGRHITAPSQRFIRYAADALGVAFDEARRHFLESGLQPGIVGAEHKAAGKPGTGAVEDFETAVRSANIPDDLKTLWLGE